MEFSCTQLRETVSGTKHVSGPRAQTPLPGAEAVIAWLFVSWLQQDSGVGKKSWPRPVQPFPVSRLMVWVRQSRVWSWGT